MHVLCSKLKLGVTAGIFLIYLGCAHRPPISAGKEFQGDTENVVLKHSGKISFNLKPKTEEIAKAVRCDAETKNPRILLRTHAQVVPMQVTCASAGISYTTFLSMESGAYEAVLRGGRNVIRTQFTIRFNFIADNPDYDSGGDETFKGAHKLALDTPAEGALAPSAGDMTDWFQFDAPKGYLWIESDKKGSTDAEITLVTSSKDGAGKPIAVTPLGKSKLVQLQGNGSSFGLQVRAKGLQEAGGYTLKVKSLEVSPTKVLRVLDIYKESDGRVTAVLDSKDLAKVPPSTMLDVFLQGRGAETKLGSCAVGSVQPSVTLCVIEQPDVPFSGGEFIARFSQEKRS